MDKAEARLVGKMIGLQDGDDEWQIDNRQEREKRRLPTWKLFFMQAEGPRKERGLALGSWA